MKYLIAILAVAGLYVSARGLQVHLMDPGLVPPCAVTEHWDCGTVNHSRYSWFPPKTVDELFDPKPDAIHIPVATLGIIGYAVILIAALVGLRWVVVVLAAGGFSFALYLSSIEEFVIHRWCIYCVWSQSIMAVILILAIVAIVLQRRSAARLVAST